MTVFFSPAISGYLGIYHQKFAQGFTETGYLLDLVCLFHPFVGELPFLSGAYLLNLLFKSLTWVARYGAVFAFRSIQHNNLSARSAFRQEVVVVDWLEFDD